MLFQRIYDEDLAQASYFIGCQASGEALVVDPRRDVRVELEGSYEGWEAATKQTVSA
jgi:hydroxyacylglutathione hydrolase